MQSLRACMKRGFAALMNGVAPNRNAQLVFPFSMYCAAGAQLATRNP
jgi:hypothetical protein